MPSQAEKRKHRPTEIAALDGLAAVINQARALITAGNDLYELLASLDWWDWERLMGRVSRDLDEDGQVLPVTLRLVLQGLSQVKKLMVGAYEKVGGCVGLAAGFIESKVRSAARVFEASSVTDKQVRDVLLSLVDREALNIVGKPASELKVG